MLPNISDNEGKKKMLVEHHTAFTLFSAIFLFPFLREKIIWFIAGGILIDIDHMILYVLYFKKVDIKDAYKFFQTGSSYRRWVCPFHTIEFLLLLLILARYFDILIPLILGIVFHISLDLIQDIKDKRLRFFSIVHWLICRDKTKI